MRTPPFTYGPGVYVVEESSGVRTITGVATSIALFIGYARQGPIDQPQRLSSIADFERRFGAITENSELAHSVRLFFRNGGSDCYILRIANNAQAASVTLQNEGANPAGVLTLTAKSAGAMGNQIRIVVDYNTPQPETTFNMRLFRVNTPPGAQQERQEDFEEFLGLSMDPNSPNYAPDVLDSRSRLVNAALAANPPAAVQGVSRSGRAVPFVQPPGNANATTQTQRAMELLATWRQLISVNGTFFLRVGNRLPTLVVLPAFPVVAPPNTVVAIDELTHYFQTAINTAFQGQAVATVTAVSGGNIGPAPGQANPPGYNDSTRLIFTASPADPAAREDVTITAGPGSNLCEQLMLGTNSGGIEIGSHAARRPAPNGLSIHPDYFLGPFAVGQMDTFLREVILPAYDNMPPNANLINLMQNGMPILQTTTPPVTMNYDARGNNSRNGNSDGIREKLRLIAREINPQRTNLRGFPYEAIVSGYRLTIRRTDTDETAILAMTTTPAASQLTPANRLENVARYSLGIGPFNGRQTPGNGGTDGTAPTPQDFNRAYQIADRQVDLFNLLILPRIAGLDRADLYPVASTYCQQRRAFLILDPPDDWNNPDTLRNGVANETMELRTGSVADHGAVFYPRVQIRDGARMIAVGPSGAVAGLMARIDATRGVWKAPAGTEATLLDVRGLTESLSPADIGTLNPRAVNCIRQRPEGIVVWGSRTLDGDDDFGSEYKYIPIRRLALYLEESIYRAIQWAVFEPNDEPLWAQLRLNIGAFMHNLFRQGAFQGSSPRDAYFVKCDSETTTQDDRNRGIVNVVIGFAPLKPAEFVVVHIQQIVGQLEV